MPAVKTGMTPPPMPGMPAPMQPMGGMPPAQNPFAPMPPMPLAGMPPPPMPPMAQGQMPQGQQGQQMGSTAGRRRRFGDALEGMLGRNQGIGAVPQQQRPMPPQMMPQQRMVAPGTPMMRTPTPRPMAMGGEVDIFGYDDGGLVIRTLSDGNAYIDFGGGAMHHVSPNQMGDDVVQSLKDAYGDRIGSVTAATAEQEADILARVAALRGNTGTSTSTSSTSSSSNSGSSSTADTSNTATSTGDVYAGSGLSGDVSSGGMSGNIGSSAGSNEMTALYGPNINIPEKVSQYVQNPVTGQITTTAGPVMTAVSPIGAINLPARPAELDIFDYLGDPTYGSLLDKQVEGMRDGGAVPRSTMIADEPHMLAYINQDEEALLRSFGGSGISGPGGIPSYPLQDLGVGATNTGKTYSGSSKAVSGGITGGRSGHATDDDDSPSKNVTYYEPPGFDFDNDGVKGEGSAVLDNNTTNPFVDYDDDDDYVVVTPTSDSSDADYVGSGSSETDFTQPVVVTSSPGGGGGGGGGGSPAPVAPPVYRDRFGREYSSQALADAANRAYATQMASYGAGQETVNELQRGIAEAFPNASREEANRLANKAYLDYGKDLADGTIGEAPLFSYAGIGGIGGSDTTGGGVGITPAPSVDPDTGTSQASNIFDITPETVPGLASAINLNAPVAPPDDDEDYTPSAEQLAKQLEAANQTNVTQGPMSVNDQVAALMERYNQFTPDQYDISRLAGDDYSAADALANMEMAGLLPELPAGTGGLRKTSASTATDDDTSTPSQTSTQTDSSTTSQDLNQGLGTGTGTGTGAGTGTDAGETEAERMKRLYGLEARGLKPGDDPRRANLAVNAAEAKYLQNLLKEFEFDKNDKMVLKDPNVAEKVLGQVIKNLSLGIVDINDLNRQRVQAVLDAYRDTGSFVYDTEGNAIDLKTVEDLERLEKLSAGRGQEPAVIGVRDKDGKVVSFGPDIKNTMEGPVAVDVFSEMSTTTGDDDDTTTTTTDDTDTGHVGGVCNNPDYVYNPETDKCEPKKEEETDGDLGSPITTAITPRSFDEVLRSVVVPAPRIAPISENIRPMQAGGMVGLNRAADNFIKALAG